MTNRIMCQDRETLKLNFQLMEQHRSWESVLISIYWIDAHDLKEICMLESDEKMLSVQVLMNPALFLHFLRFNQLANTQ